MERLPTHAVEPGGEGQILRIVDGEAVWVPLTLADITAPDVVPTVAASTTVRRTSGPYGVPLPAGVNGSGPDVFVGKFVVVLHWESTSPDAISDLLALTDWELLAYSATARTGNGPVVAVVGGDPRPTVTLDIGGGVCELSLIAVANASTFRGLPLPTPTMIVDSATTTSRWASPTSAVTGDGTFVKASAASGGLYGFHSILDITGDTDLTNHPLVTVEWAPAGTTTVQLAMSVTGKDNGTVYGSERYSTVDIGGGWKRTVFEVNDPRIVSRVRFDASAYGNGGSGYDLFIREVTATASPRARIMQLPGAFQSQSVGVPTQQDDVMLIVTAASPAGEALTFAGDVGPDGSAPVAASAGGNATLTTKTWLSTIEYGGTKVVRTVSSFGTTGLAVAVIAVNGQGEAAPGGGGGVPLGGDEGDVLTLVDGDVAWAPPSGGGAALPAGGAYGDVLTLEDGVAVWRTPALPPSTKYLVPLTTVVAGEPMLMWTEDNQLIFVEETLT